MSLDISRFLPKEINAPPTPLVAHGCFIHGPRSCGKTSFAFQAVINTVVGEEERVIILCQEHVLYEKMPKPFTPLEELNEDALTRIEFAYLSSMADVVRELSSWTVGSSLPALVVVDDEAFLDAGDERLTAVMLSMLENVSAWAKQFNGVFHYIVVTNSYPDRGLREKLPFATFPLIWFTFGSVGSVQVAVAGTSQVSTHPLMLEWRDSLTVRSLWSL